MGVPASIEAQGSGASVESFGAAVLVGWTGVLLLFSSREFCSPVGAGSPASAVCVGNVGVVLFEGTVGFASSHRGRVPETAASPTSSSSPVRLGRRKAPSNEQPDTTSHGTRMLLNLIVCLDLTRNRTRGSAPFTNVQSRVAERRAVGTLKLANAAQLRNGTRFAYDGNRARAGELLEQGATRGANES